MTTRDPILVRLSGGRTLALGVVIGGPSAPVNTALRCLASALEAGFARVDDITASDAGPALKGQRKAEALGPIIKSLNEHSTTTLSVRSALQKRMSAPTVAPWGPTTAFYTTQVDLAIAARFAAMSPQQRAVTLATIRAKPLDHLDDLEALIRVPRTLTGLTADEHAGLGTTAHRALRPDDHEMMLAELEKLSMGERAVVLASQWLVDAGAARADIAALAPAALEVATLSPLAFADEHPEAPPLKAA